MNDPNQEAENRIRRILLGGITFLILATGVLLWALGVSQSPGVIPYYSLCWKVGPVLFMMWLAWNQLVNLPTWAFVAVPMIIIPMLVNRRLLVFAVPLAILLALLNHPWIRRHSDRKD